MQDSIDREIKLVYFKNRFAGPKEKSYKENCSEDRLESQSVRHLRDKLSEILRVDDKHLSTLRIEFPKMTSKMQRDRVENLLQKLNIKVGNNISKPLQDTTVSRTAKLSQPDVQKPLPTKLNHHSTEKLVTVPKPAVTKALVASKSLDLENQKSKAMISFRKSLSPFTKARNVKDIVLQKPKKNKKRSKDKLEKLPTAKSKGKDGIVLSLKKYLNQFPSSRKTKKGIEKSESKLETMGNIPKSSAKIAFSPRLGHLSPIHDKNKRAFSRKHSTFGVNTLEVSSDALKKAILRSSYNDTGNFSFLKNIRPVDEAHLGSSRKDASHRSKKQMKTKPSNTRNGLVGSSTSQLELSHKKSKMKNLQLKLDILDQKIAGHLIDCFHSRKESTVGKPKDLIPTVTSPVKQTNRKKDSAQWMRMSTDHLTSPSVMSTRLLTNEPVFDGFFRVAKKPHAKILHSRIPSLTPLGGELGLSQMPRFIKFSAKLSGKLFPK